MPTPEEYESARTALDTAVRDYFTTCQPDENVLVSSWVLVAHKMFDGDNGVVTVTPDDQSYVTDRGLLDIALAGDRSKQEAGWYYAMGEAEDDRDY